MREKPEHFTLVSDLTSFELKRQGYQIDEVQTDNHFLEIPDIAENLHAYIARRHFESTPGDRTIVINQADSTMDLAEGLIRNGQMKAKDVLIAVHQTQGRGQNGREWTSAPGNCYLNVCLDTGNNNIISVLSLLVGLAVKETLEDYAVSGEVKWPNDVVVQKQNGVRAKIAGVLVTAYPDLKLANVGIGVNIKSKPQVPADRFVQDVTCIRAESKHFNGLPLDLGVFSEALMGRLNHELTEIEFAGKRDFYDRYNAALAGQNGLVRLHNEQKNTYDEGLLVGMNEDTDLLQIGSKFYSSGRLEIIDKG